MTSQLTRGPAPRAQDLRPDAVPALHLRGVTKDFGEVHAVRGIDLVVEPGEIVAFLGPNGAGKTAEAVRVADEHGWP